MTDDKKKGGKGYGNLRPELRQKYFKHLNERSKVAGPHDEGKRKKPEPSLTQILEEYFEEETKLPDAVGTIEIAIPGYRVSSTPCRRPSTSGRRSNVVRSISIIVVRASVLAWSVRLVKWFWTR